VPGSRDAVTSAARPPRVSGKNARSDSRLAEESVTRGE
jgi:hypothetical protein